MIVEDSPKPISHICRLTMSKNEKIAVRRNSRPGSSASMPTPDAMGTRCLKDQITDQQRPAHSEKDSADVVYHRHTFCKIGKVCVE